MLRYIEKSTLHFAGHEVLNNTVNQVLGFQVVLFLEVRSELSLLCEPIPSSHPLRPMGSRAGCRRQCGGSPA